MRPTTNLLSYKDFIEESSKEFQYHLDNGIGISDSVFRLGSEAYHNLFEETKKLLISFQLR